MGSGELKNVVVLGSSGMLGNAVFGVLNEETLHPVYGATRSYASAHSFPPSMRERIIPGVDAENFDSLVDLMNRVRPATVVNCIGLVKQKADANDPLAALPINSILPHRLARLCAVSGARLIHISTDCVFDGGRGGYDEDDIPNATDLYGRSKLLGEVDYPNAVTLRTSIVGHERGSRNGLIDWFLSQEGTVNGFTKAIFSGLTTVELSRVIAHYVMPNSKLHGLHHVSADPISKFELLSLVSEIYGKTIEIKPDPNLVINRSLSSEKFRALTGYLPPAWPKMVADLHNFYGKNREGDNFKIESNVHA